MLYYHTCTPPQDIYDEIVQHFHGLARSFGYIGIKKQYIKTAYRSRRLEILFSHN